MANNKKMVTSGSNNMSKKPVVKKVVKPTERIVLRKIYPGPAALFSLLHALCWAVIGFLVVLIYGFIAKGGIVIGTARYGTAGQIFLFSLMVFLILFVGLFVMTFLCCLIYNLVSKMKGKLHIGLAEYVAPPKKPKMAPLNKKTATNPMVAKAMTEKK